MRQGEQAMRWVAAWGPWRVAAGALLVLLMAVACGGGGGTDAPGPQRAPNLVYILTDDQDMASLATMPNVQRLLADQGMRFTRHYVSLSLCCPSRVSALRGQYAHNTTIFKNNAPDGGFEGTHAKGLEQSTLATWLQGAGYRTGFFGKYLNGYPNTASATYIPPGWTEWVSPNGGTPYKQFNYTLNDNGRTVSHGEAAADYLTDVLAGKAVDFITRAVDQAPNQPFFAYVATFAPHAPATPAPRHEAAYPGATAPRTAAWNETDVSDKPAWVRGQALLNATQIADIDQLYRRRLQSLLAVDELVARVVATLEAKGQLGQTYIVFTSDNGYHQGQHRMDSGKMTAYEEDLWVPLLVRGPGVAAGSSNGLITANVDHAPTLAELAGAAPPAFVDGRSLLPLLQGQVPASWRQVLLLEHKPDGNDEAARAVAPAGVQEPDDAFQQGGAHPDITAFTGLRTADGWSYVEYESGEFELYDHSSDPQQLRNAYDGAAADQRSRLARWVAALKTAAGPALRAAEATAP